MFSQFKVISRLFFSHFYMRSGFVQKVGGGSIKIALRFYKESVAFLEAKPSASPMEPPQSRKINLT